MNAQNLPVLTGLAKVETHAVVTARPVETYGSCLPDDTLHPVELSLSVDEVLWIAATILATVVGVQFLGL